MIRSVTTFLLCCGLFLASAAQPRKVFPLTYDQKDFPNGLRLLTIPTDYPNVVALYIVVNTGSRNEVEPGKSGFAHLFEHMMFRGTKAFPQERYAAEIQSMGAAQNAYTTDDLTCYHTTFSKEDLPRMVELEADRFRNLTYSPAVFKTETQAVLGEFNKNSASPMSKLDEVLSAAAFKEHTYRHTTMGFLEDIRNMPTLYDYSRQFFDRYYRPEYTTVVVVGDVTAATTVPLVEKYFGSWPRGSFRPSIPQEPAQTAPREAHVDWPTPTLPWLVLGFRVPAYADDSVEVAALDLVARLGFGSTSALYQQLVIRDQQVDALFAQMPRSIDPSLFTINARLKRPADLDAVRTRIQATLEELSTKPVSAEELERVKSNLRYSFATRMDNSQAIAATLARYIALRRTPETINRYFETLARVTPADLQAAARRFFVAEGRTTVTLTAPASRPKSQGGQAR